MAIFTLSTPIKVVLSGAHGPRREVMISTVTMRALDARDLPLLDVHRGQPIAIATHLIAALGGLTLAQIAKLAMDDFAALGAFALREVSAVSMSLGFDAEFFFRSEVPPE